METRGKVVGEREVMQLQAPQGSQVLSFKTFKEEPELQEDSRHTLTTHNLLWLLPAPRAGDVTISLPLETRVQYQATSQHGGKSNAA